MTPKEKAKELVDTYLDALSYINPLNEYFDSAKVLALMCVNEIIDSHYKVFTGIKESVNDYWQEVKQEINKLN